MLHPLAPFARIWEEFLHFYFFLPKNSHLSLKNCIPRSIRITRDHNRPRDIHYSSWHFLYDWTSIFLSKFRNWTCDGIPLSLSMFNEHLTVLPLELGISVICFSGCVFFILFISLEHLL